MRANNFVRITLLTISSACQAADHPIDSYLNLCIEADSTTAGMVNCTNQAYSLWEKELPIKYNNLISALNPADRQAFRNAQSRWIAFRDAELKAIYALYSHKHGTMYASMRAADRLQVVKTRALELESHMGILVD